jgi:hypothetical protein
MKAIIVPYTVCQNEPSRPLSQIFDLPDDVEMRNEMLRNIFKEFVYDEAEDDEISVRTSRDEHEYGDIIVSFGDDIFMFVTWVTSIGEV